MKETVTIDMGINACLEKHFFTFILGLYPMSDKHNQALKDALKA
jgi:hypothetical protein